MPHGEGVVYFLLDETSRLIKIGFTTNVIEKRLGQVRSNNPNPITLLGVIEADDRSAERAIHYQFRSARRAYEWFEATEELLSFVRERSFIPGTLVKDHPFTYCDVCRWRRSGNLSLPCAICGASTPAQAERVA